MPLYWFVAVPCGGDKHSMYSMIKLKLREHGEVHQFSIPEFKTVSLDSLMVLSDELAKYDSAAEATTTKLISTIRTLLSDNVDQIKSNLSVSEMESYVKTFQWNSMKYRTDWSLPEIATAILNEVSNMDNLMKHKMATYTQLKGTLTVLQQKQRGNLSVRSLDDIVKKEHVVQDSEFLVTLLVAVRRQDEDRWITTYEKGLVKELVVPRSSQKLAEDSEYAIFNVTLFQKVVGEFTNRCQEEKFVVRDFRYDEQQMAAAKTAIQELGASEKEMLLNILRLAKTNFAEAFSCVIHLKTMRVFVEAVLRYGLPPTFLSFTIKPKAKHELKVKHVLNSEYEKGSSRRMVVQQGSGDQKEEGLQAYEPYLDNNYLAFVFFPLHWEIMQKTSAAAP